MGYFLPSSIADPSDTPETAYPLSAKSISGYRFYVPEIGRWASRDPVGERGARNLFRALRNAPLATIDPTGLLDTTVPLDIFDTVFDIIQAINRAVEIGREIEDLVEQLTRAVEDVMSSVRQGIDDLERLRREGHAQFPGEANSAMRHCWAACEATKRYGNELARLSGVINELQGLIIHDYPNLWRRITGRSPWAFQIADLIDNETGITCASDLTLSCADCCRRACAPQSPGAPPPIYPGTGGRNTPPVIIYGIVPSVPSTPESGRI